MNISFAKYLTNFKTRYGVVLCASVLLAIQSPVYAAGLEEVDDFGSNPGKLTMYKYVPAKLQASAPLVVALHGCSQSASYGKEAGWNEVAEKFGFIVLLPETNLDNNIKACFNWYMSEHTSRDKGEALSIRQMIDKIQEQHNIDSSRIYVSGVSAGGAMTSVMLAAYPDVFAGGGILAGVPFGCANNILDGLACIGSVKNLTGQQWGDFVRNASPHSGPWPRVSIWHGQQDPSVNPNNSVAIAQQWVNLHNIDINPGEPSYLKDAEVYQFKDANGKTVVENVWVPEMEHGVAVDPGSESDQCGVASEYFHDVELCASFYIAKFWGMKPVVSDDTDDTDDTDNTDEPDVIPSIDVKSGVLWNTFIVRGMTQSADGYDAQLQIQIVREDGTVIVDEPVRVGRTGHFIYLKSRLAPGHYTATLVLNAASAASDPVVIPFDIRQSFGWKSSLLESTKFDGELSASFGFFNDQPVIMDS